MPKSKGAVAEPPATTAPQKSRKPAPSAAKPKPLPPYRVLLHNDDVNDMVLSFA